MSTDRRRDELRAVVAANMLGNATCQEQVRQNVEHPLGRQAPIDLQRQAFTRVFIGDREPLQRSTPRRAIVNEVPSPNVILPLCTTPHAAVGTVPQTTAFHGSFRHFQALTLPQTVHPLEVHAPAALPQLGRHHSIAVTRIPRRQRVQILHQPLLFDRVLARTVTLRAPRLTQRPTCPTLTHALPLPNVVDRSASSRRAQ